MNKKLTQEEISQVLKGLEGNILIVEGKKDEQALRGLYPGYSWLKPRGSTLIIRIDGRPMEKVAENADSLMEKHKNSQIIIMTDFDRTGRRLAAKIRLFLQSRKIHANSRIRRDVMNLGIKCIEEMVSLESGTFLEERISRQSLGSGIAKQRGDDYGEIGANFYKIRDKSLHKGKRDNRKARRDRGNIRAD